MELVGVSVKVPVEVTVGDGEKVWVKV